MQVVFTKNIEEQEERAHFRLVRHC